MSVFTFDNFGSQINGNGEAGNYWNYSSPDKPNYTIRLDGDVVELKQVQATSYGDNLPQFWGPNGKTTEDTGKPVLNFAVVISTAQLGEVEWQFSPKTRKTPQNPQGLTPAAQAIYNGLMAAGIANPCLDDLLGKSVTVWTNEPPQGFSYGQGNPRPFGLQVNGDGSAPVRGCTPWTAESAAALPANMNANLRASLQQAQQASQQHPFQQAMAPAMPPAMQGLNVAQVKYEDADIPF